MNADEFLRATSIHGLRYLTESKGSVVRFLWFAVISTSFTLATVISFFNVLSWQHQPATITQAAPAMIKARMIYRSLLVL